jgi:hypothetical protein
MPNETAVSPSAESAIEMQVANDTHHNGVNRLRLVKNLTA